MKFATLFAAAIATTAVLTATPAADASGGTINFAIRAIDAERGGTIRCALYDNEDDFLSSKKHVAVTTVVADGKAVGCRFRGIPRGTYAAAALHDEDGDQEMDKTLGIPEEGYAVSRDAHRRGLVPDWEDARFDFKGRAGRVDASMKY